MNILLITDLEGVPGVTDIDFIDTNNEKYQKAKEALTECINKTGEYCLRYGADKVYYFDGHGGPALNNVIEEKINPMLIKTDIEGWQMLAKRGKIDACIELGSHARAGTVGGFLDHTMSSKVIFTHRINGEDQSELSLHALFLGEFDIPTVCCIGDKAACDQAKEYISGIVCAPIKTATQRNSCTDEKNPYGIIECAVKEALSSINKIKPIKAKKPIKAEVTYYRTDMCEGVLVGKTDTEHVDARTLRKVSRTIEKFSDLNI